VLCGSNGDVVRECKWCSGKGVKGNGVAGQSNGQLHPFKDPLSGSDERVTVGV
jgi:hypothetical protein